MASRGGAIVRRAERSPSRTGVATSESAVVVVFVVAALAFKFVAVATTVAVETAGPRTQDSIVASGSSRLFFGFLSFQNRYNARTRALGISGRLSCTT